MSHSFLPTTLTLTIFILLLSTYSPPQLPLGGVTSNRNLVSFIVHPTFSCSLLLFLLLIVHFATSLLPPPTYLFRYSAKIRLMPPFFISQEPKSPQYLTHPILFPKWKGIKLFSCHASQRKMHTICILLLLFILFRTCAPHPVPNFEFLTTARFFLWREMMNPCACFTLIRNWRNMQVCQIKYCKIHMEEWRWVGDGIFCPPTMHCDSFQILTEPNCTPIALHWKRLVDKRFAGEGFFQNFQREGFFENFCTWMCLPDSKMLTFAIPVFSALTTHQYTNFIHQPPNFAQIGCFLP